MPETGFPAVGRLEMVDGYSCTGTLVTKRTVITAAHCATNDHPPAKFNIGPNGYAPEAVVEVESYTQHWMYDPEFTSGLMLGMPYDVALVTLKQDAPVDPMPVGFVPMDCKEGTPVVFVGYGMTNPAEPGSSGQKMSLSIDVAMVVASGFWTQTFPGMAKNACPGDSGGPVLMLQGDRVAVVGVLSLADKFCESETFAVRLDVHEGWFFSTLEAQEPGAASGACGDSVCDFKEDADTCPSDCTAGSVDVGGACTADDQCLSNLECVEVESQGTCSLRCPSPETGTGCPCGYFCQMTDMVMDGAEDGGPVGAGSAATCVPLVTAESQCGNTKCEAGETAKNCSFDCTLPDCNEIGKAGCCAGAVAQWCKDGTLVMDNCEAAGKCGWDEALARYGCGTSGAKDPSGANPKVCGPPGPQCGNGLCEKGEDKLGCPPDCLYDGYCGDGICNGYEDGLKCEADCRKGICEVAAEKGCCQDNVAVWCLDSDQFKFSCEHHPQCGWDAAAGAYGCATDGSAEPSGQYPKECSAYMEDPCGNGTCDKDETWETCPDDCEPPPPGCGDGVCAQGEDYTTCPADCYQKGCGKILEQGCCDGDVLKWCIGTALFMANCEDKPSCGWSDADGFYDCGTEGQAEPSGVYLMDCAAVDAAVCGDGACTAGEESFFCPEDCAAKTECGDGTCEGDETADSCPDDCAPADLGPEPAGDAGLGPEAVASPEMVTADGTSDAVSDTGSGGSGSGGCTVGAAGGPPLVARLLLAALLCIGVALGKRAALRDPRR